MLNGRERWSSGWVQGARTNIGINGPMKGDLKMKRITKIALGALMLAGAATVGAAPASARVFVGVGGPIGYVPAAPACDPYSPYYNPYYCGYGPGYVGGPVLGFGFGGWGGGFHGGGFHGGSFHGGGGFHGGGHH
jgi:hypothetical protein